MKTARTASDRFENVGTTPESDSPNARNVADSS
jgi:hypothetical protein